MTVLLLELNEINFDHVRRFVAQGKLPTLGRLIARHGVDETVSEPDYAAWEPWIQWVTAHTGKTLAEHKVFRLGDIVGHDLPQVWDVLEAQGVRVGAVSPMNATNRCVAPAFFVPDPWTDTRVTGSGTMKRLHGAIAQAVNDNATAAVTPGSLLNLAVGAAAYARPRNYLRYFGLAAGAARRKPWRKAIFLDQLLADVFVRRVAATQPGFASLFLNAGAHIQHHYLFNSGAYEGALANPAWYVAADADPILEVYELYDRTVAQVAAAVPDARLILATGLHQVPHDALTFYWRLRDHAGFLRAAGVPFARVEPRMSRDFVVFGSDAEQAAEAGRRLDGIVGPGGEKLFAVDNRGASLFVEFVWPHDIPADFEYRIGNVARTGLKDAVAFVAIKNGEHDGIGYVIDTARDAAQGSERFALAELPARIAAGCGVRWPGRGEAP